MKKDNSLKGRILAISLSSSALVLSGCNTLATKADKELEPISDSTTETITLTPQEEAEGFCNSFYTPLFQKFVEPNFFAGGVKPTHNAMERGAEEQILMDIAKKEHFNVETGEFNDNVVIKGSGYSKKLESIKLKASIGGAGHQGFDLSFVFSPRDHQVELKSYEEQCNVLSTMLVPLKSFSSQAPIDLIASGINGALKEFDPHSHFFLPEEFKKLSEETRGVFAGIGVHLDTKDDVISILKIIDDGPSYGSGLLENDVIIAVDGEDLHGKSPEESIALIRGEDGEPVKISVKRGENELLDFLITRGFVAEHTVMRSSFDHDIELIKVSHFALNTSDQLRAILADIRQDSNPKDIILDLRNDPGGVLSGAVYVTDTLVDLENGETDKAIVSVKYANPNQPNDVYFLDEQVTGEAPQGRIVVLQNIGSASASEIVAGAMRDYGYEIIGSDTFGKGSVQSIRQLTNDGIALKLTTAFFYPADGKSNQHSGNKPTILVIDPYETAAAVGRPREADLGHSILPTSETRADDKPHSICKATATYAGALSQEQQESVPENLQLRYRVEGTTLPEGNMKGLSPIFLAADVACAIEELNPSAYNFVEISAYIEPLEAGY